MNISSATYQKDIDDASVNAYIVAVIDGVIVNLCNSSTIISWLINVFLFPVGRET